LLAKENNQLGHDGHKNGFVDDVFPYVRKSEESLRNLVFIRNPIFLKRHSICKCRIFPNEQNVIKNHVEKCTVDQSDKGIIAKKPTLTFKNMQ
jgi:hypothetical protein